MKALPEVINRQQIYPVSIKNETFTLWFGQSLYVWSHARAYAKRIFKSGYKARPHFRTLPIPV